MDNQFLTCMQGKITAGNRRAVKKRTEIFQSALRKIWKQRSGRRKMYIWLGGVVTIRQDGKLRRKMSRVLYRRSKSKSCKDGQ